MTGQDILPPAQQAAARSHIYAALSRLFLDGLDIQLAEFLRRIPQLAAAVPDPLDPEESAADHYELFQREMFPFESFFLQDTGLVGGEITDQLQRWYDGAGYRLANRETSADHLGLELDALSFLCGAEGDAWKDDQTGQVGRVRQKQLQLLQLHLLRWVFPLIIGLRRQTDRLYQAAAELLQAALIDHYQQLSAGLAPLPSSASFSLPARSPLLQLPETSLRDIASFLTRPAACGVYLTHQQISSLGRGLDLPRGFGSRQQTLLNLLRTAVQYNALPLLLDALQSLFLSWGDAYQEQIAASTAIVPFVKPWSQAAAAAGNMLAEINMQANSLHE